jgi:two-component system, chemotaxis family, protein-glutamate methylesterase/glutaminase
MRSSRVIRVLVVDDSMVFREVLARGLSSDPSIEVVATASDPFEARDRLLQCSPDVMTCDVEMPRMNGIEFIRRLLPQYPLPVIVVSTVNGAVFDAMQVGAVDFVSKPDIRSLQDTERFILDLIQKVKAACQARMDVMKAPYSLHQATQTTAKATKTDKRVIAIAASTGGTVAIQKVLEGLPADIPGIVIVQHIPAIYSRMFAERLNEQTAFRVREAKSGDVLAPGTVLVAPGDRHMRVRAIGNEFVVECEAGPKVSGHCPSADVLFESVARTAGQRAIGVLLTGMGYDGAKGLQLMRRKGGRTIGQDADSSVVYGMPRMAYELGAVEKQAPLQRIPYLILSLLNNKGPSGEG